MRYRLMALALIVGLGAIACTSDSDGRVPSNDDNTITIEIDPGDYGG